MKFKEFYNLYIESLENWPNEWVHYSNIPFLSINPKQAHSDPAGLYFFPSNFKPVSSYTSKPYKFTAKLKPEAKVLDLSKIDRAEMRRLADLAGVISFIEVEDWWAKIKGTFSYNAFSTKRAGSFNRFFRNAGYDAIFDDIAVIYGKSETQLLVLNPRMLTDVQFFYNKHQIYSAMIKSVNEVIRGIEPFSDSFQKSKIVNRREWGRENVLQCTVTFTKGENSLTIKAYSDSGSKKSNEISFSIILSNPRLKTGSGAAYDYVKNEWTFNSINRLIEDSKKVLTGVDERI